MNKDLEHMLSFLMTLYSKVPLEHLLNVSYIEIT